MIFLKTRVSIVRLTYSKRWHFLYRTLNYIKDNSLIIYIIVVDNASKEEIESLCKA